MDSYGLRIYYPMIYPVTLFTGAEGRSSLEKQQTRHRGNRRGSQVCLNFGRKFGAKDGVVTVETQFQNISFEHLFPSKLISYGQNVLGKFHPSTLRLFWFKCGYR